MAKKKGKENEIKEPVTNCDQFDGVVTNCDNQQLEYGYKVYDSCHPWSTGDARL